MHISMPGRFSQEISSNIAHDKSCEQCGGLLSLLREGKSRGSGIKRLSAVCRAAPPTGERPVTGCDAPDRAIAAIATTMMMVAVAMTASMRENGKIVLDLGLLKRRTSA
jgi:hypothetical protein